MLKKGIILIATGHAGYGKLAYNLALSIKAAELIDIAVVHSGAALSHLTEDQKGVFDYIIDLPDTYESGFKAKLHLDQLTPFTSTLYLDADMLWLSKMPSDLFKDLDGSSFSIITEGCSDAVNPKYYFWADVVEIKKAYSVDKIWQTRSEVIYFEKGTKVFKKLRELKPEKKLNSIRMFGEHIPDELYFNIGMGLLNIDPHVPNWMPAYWPRLHGDIIPNMNVLRSSYYLLSFGSNAVSPIMKKTYDNIMMVVANKLRIRYMFPLKSKKEWAPGRLKI